MKRSTPCSPRRGTGRIAWLAGLALLALLAGCGEESTEPTPPDTLEGVLSQIRRDFSLPAIAGAIVTSQGPPRVYVEGVRQLGQPDTVEAADRFHLGSTTKSMTATLIGMLVDEGKLSWDSRPLDIFTDLEDTINDVYRDVTLAQLLSHRAGLPDFTQLSDFPLVPPLTGTPTEQRRQFSIWILGQAATAHPGVYVYSNAGYTVATAMAEQVARDSWESMIVTRLFTPLGIQAGFGWPAAADSTQPWGHWVEYGVLRPHDPNGTYQVPQLIAPAVDLNMSAGDFARFAQLHLRGLRGDASLLTAATFARLHQPTGDYALGWFEGTVDGNLASWNSGSASTFDALIVVEPSTDRAAVVLTNACTSWSYLGLRQAAAWMLNLE